MQRSIVTLTRQDAEREQQMVHAGRKIAQRQPERAEQSANEDDRPTGEPLAQRTRQWRQRQAQRRQDGRDPRGDRRRAVRKRLQDLHEQHAVRLDQSGHPELHEERAQHDEPSVAAVQRLGRSHAPVTAAEAFGQSAHRFEWRRTLSPNHITSHIFCETKKEGVGIVLPGQQITQHISHNLDLELCVCFRQSHTPCDYVLYESIRKPKDQNETTEKCYGGI